MPKLGGWIVLGNRISRLHFGSALGADLTYQWNTKRKLFSLAEVCALPSAVPVINYGLRTRCKSYGTNVALYRTNEIQIAKYNGNGQSSTSNPPLIECRG